MTDLTWTATDLDSPASSDGVVHQSTANTDHNDAAVLKQGYDYASFSEITPDPIGCWPHHDGFGESEGWTGDTNNPLFDNYADPDWIEVSGTYYIYAFEVQNQQIDLLTSSDGVSWTNQGVILDSSASGFDSNFVADPSIVEDGGTYYLYYAGHNGSGYAGIGVATASAPDGSFSKSGSNPILTSGSTGAWDEARVNEPHVRIKDGTFHMMYTGQDSGGSEAIGHATATDGVTYSKDSSNPVYNPSENVNDQCHIHVDGEWHLYFTGGSGTTRDMKKVSSSDISNFGTALGTVVVSAADGSRNWSPAIRFDSGASEYKMYWHEQTGNTAPGDYHIMLHTSPSVGFGTANDLAGANDGTVKGGVTSNQTGILGTSSFNYDGVDGTQTDVGDIDWSTGELSVVAWGKLPSGGTGDSVNRNTILSKTYSFQLVVGDSSFPLFMYIGDGSTWGTLVSGGSDYRDGSWHQFACTYSDADDYAAVWADGSLVAEDTSYTDSIGMNDNPVLIGARHPGGADLDPWGFGGDLTDVRFYDSRLTASQIQTLYDVVDTSGSLITAGKTS